jgi:hypothetical protein
VTSTRYPTLKDTRVIADGLWTIAPTRGEAVRWPRDRLAFGDDTLAELAASIDESTA